MVAPVSWFDTFRLQLTVLEDDIDALGHASNISFVRWLQDAAIAHSVDLGLGLDAYRRMGAVFVVVRHEIDYVRPAMLGDVIEARTRVTDVMAAKCLRATELVRLSGGELLAKGVTTWGFIEIATGRPKRIPPEVRLSLEAQGQQAQSPLEQV
jgi:acyl-CoA thioester hydrolase